MLQFGPVGVLPCSYFYYVGVLGLLKWAIFQQSLMAHWYSLRLSPKSPEFKAQLWKSFFSIFSHVNGKFKKYKKVSWHWLGLEPRTLGWLSETIPLSYRELLENFTIWCMFMVNLFQIQPTGPNCSIHGRVYHSYIARIVMGSELGKGPVGSELGEGLPCLELGEGLTR